ncbi:MAG: RNA polymerase factor sigma-54 [Variibacter sp.]
MALSQKLEIRQSQGLVMTPQLMQAIKLLQLSTLDLTAYVEAELERNPLLEREPDGDGDAGNAERETSDDGAGAAASEARSDDWMDGDLETSRSAIEAQLDTDLENVFPSDGEAPAAPTHSAELGPSSEWASVGNGGRDNGDYNLEAFVSSERSLGDHLAEQLALAIPDPARRLIGAYLLDLVDEAGYIAGDLAAVAEKLGTTASEIESVLAILQTFDPVGVCARNLAECLAIQLKERDRFDPAMQTLIANIELLAKRDLAALRKLCGVDDEDIAEMIAEVRRLNPKPGLSFGSSPVQPVVPDVHVRAGPDGGWLVELNNETLPRVLVNQLYYATVSKSARSASEKSYLADCMQNGTWLVRALDQRARTIVKVSMEIVRQQDAFFAYGVQHLRPLNLRTVADAISMHESTVSRVTANKYMATPRGIFELKYFFTSAIAAANGGDAHSAEAVRHRIKRLIDEESSSDILSDDTIVEKLREAGIDIARRTVAKYREAMRIPSSVQRRREKQSAARIAL